MPKRIIPLSDMKVQKAKSKDKTVTLFDGGGLFLMITPTGGKLWRFKYRFDSKEKKIAFGTYPEISLFDARRKRDDARRLLANDVDPGAVRKAQKQAKVEDTETVEVIAREWHEKFKSKWTEGHAQKIMRSFELDVFPWIGIRPIKEIKAPELLTVLRRVESRGVLEGAHRIRGLCNMIFRYAVSTGRAERNPAQDLIGSLPSAKERHLAAITEPKKVAELLRAIDGYSGRTFDRPMSNNAILAALRRMGYTKDEMTPHGFRAIARTIIDEVLQVRPDFIETQLAHRVSDPLGRSYNRTQHLNERRKMMQKWADYLDGLRAGAKVIPFKKLIES